MKPSFLSEMKIPICFLPSPKPESLPVDFVLCDCPASDKLKEYADFFYAHNVRHVIRICTEITYSSEELRRVTSEKQEDSWDIQVHDQFKFEDGSVPETEMAMEYLDFIAEIVMAEQQKQVKDKRISIAVHCVSGLGRAPILICMAELEYIPKWDPEDAIEWMRQHRRGAINKRQLAWIQSEFEQKIRRKNFVQRHRPKRVASPTKNKKGLFKLLGLLGKKK